jgi:alkanesulfonate monooxygenase SsuD/methylene tetrahydromethanopterin reductase-like flavin-dependent oxidoreductase (luciferase family)
MVGRNSAEVKDKMQLATQGGRVADEDFRNHNILGTPEQCTERIGEYSDIGVDRFMLSFPEEATDLSGLRLFAEEVLPNLK